LCDRSAQVSFSTLTPLPRFMYVHGANVRCSNDAPFFVHSLLASFRSELNHPFLMRKDIILRWLFRDYFCAATGSVQIPLSLPSPLRRWISPRSSEKVFPSTPNSTFLLSAREPNFARCSPSHLPPLRFFSLLCAPVIDDGYRYVPKFDFRTLVAMRPASPHTLVNFSVFLTSK